MLLYGRDGAIPFNVYHRPESSKPGINLAFPICFIPTTHTYSETIKAMQERLHPCIPDTKYPFAYRVKSHYQSPSFIDHLECFDPLGCSILGQTAWSSNACGVARILLGSGRNAPGLQKRPKKDTFDDEHQQPRHRPVSSHNGWDSLTELFLP